MAHFLRGKQAGIQKDFSAGLDAQRFVPDLVARYGVNSQVSALAYDPIQSLLAVGTNDTKFGPGQIYVFGQKRVAVTLRLSRRASVRTLQFCSDKIVCVDSKNDISIFALDTTRIVGSYSPPGSITALATDPTLDFAIIGLQTGDVIAYDLDRQTLAPFKVPNLLREQNPRSRPSSVVSLAFHPRDIGSLLIGYSEGTVIFSFQNNAPTKFFRYEVPAGAAGGALDTSPANLTRYPRVSQALWHPTGTFVLTVHEDSSLVIWDPRDGRKILARSLQAINVDQPGSSLQRSSGSSEPIFRVAWCCKENPDDTGLLIAGGGPAGEDAKGLTFWDLGPTPNYATSSWHILSDHFSKPKREQRLATPPNAEVADFCLIPRKSPYFAGCCDPVAVVTLLGSGELITSSFPSGHPISPTNQLSIDLTFVHPFVNHFDLGLIDRTQWLGMMENRAQGPKILKGGAEATHSTKRYVNRIIMQTAHADGTVRLYDGGYGDEIENEDVLQVDVARAIGRFHDVDICKMAIGSTTGELAVGLKTGEVAMFRWGKNKDYGREVHHREARGFGLEAIADRAEPDLKEGLQPLTLLDHHEAPVTALKVSEVGFVCAAFADGWLSVVDLRGPALIYDVQLNEIQNHAKVRSSIRKAASTAHGQSEWVTSLEFGVMSLEGDDWSSILLFAGTNSGHLFTLKLLPEASGGYSVQPAGTVPLDDIILAIQPLNVDSGAPASASPDVVGSLRTGNRINGVILVATQSGARIFKPATAKGASKSWDSCLLYSAAVVKYEAYSFGLVGLFGDGTAKVFSLPGLKEIASTPLADYFDVRRFAEAVVTPTGLVYGWMGPSEVGVIDLWGTGQDLTRSLDRLFNVEALIPARPTISNLQWISGTSYVSPAEMDKLIGGPDRPPSKRMIELQRADEAAQRTAGRQAAASSSRQPPSKQDEGYWAYMQRQIQERTENLGLAGDSMDKLEGNSEGWANDVNKYVRDQKRKMVMGAISSKFGL